MENEIKNILARLEKLEAAVFGPKNTRPSTKDQIFKGASGGVKFLLTKDYFSKKRTASEVKAELEKHQYVYRVSVVQMALNRLSAKNGPMTSSRENSVKVYVARR